MFLFYFILLIYFFSIVWILNGYKNVIKKDTVYDDYNPLVSIIVSARNEERNLEKLFEFLVNQLYKNYEVIIINDRSVDKTESILLEYSNKYKNISYLTIQETPRDWSNKKWAIYNGILAARGEIIIQTDADCYMSNKWVQLMISPFKNSDVGFVSSLTPIIYPQNNIFRNLFLMDSIAQDIFSGYAIGQS